MMPRRDNERSNPDERSDPNARNNPNERSNPKAKPVPGESQVQGEGDYISGKRYQKDVEEFTRTHDTEKLAREAAPRSEAEQKEMIEAERKGKSRAKGRKPARR